MHTINKLLGISFIWLIFFFCVPFAFAQSSDIKIENCFKYYDYGKAQVHLSAEKIQYKPKEKINLEGQLVNNNTFPLMNVTLLAQIRRKNTTSYSTNGHFFVDQIVLQKDINLPALTVKNVKMTLPVLSSYPTGSYQIQYYLLSKYGFHYGGRSFLEEDHAGTTNFEIINANKDIVYFDIDDVRVNDTVRPLRGLIDEFPKGVLRFNLNIVDTRQTPTSLPVQIKVYSFEEALEDRLVTQTTTTTENGRIQFNFNPPKEGAYVLLAQIDSPSKTILKYRFAATESIASDLQMNDVGVSSFPATNNSRAWVCFHSPSNAVSPLTTVILNVYSNNQRLVDSAKITKSFDSSVQAISVPLSKLSSPNDFWVEALFIDPNTSDRSRSVKIHYSCDVFSKDLKSMNLTFDRSASPALVINGTNVCGDKLKDVYINSLKVTQNNNVVVEKTNFTQSGEKFSLAQLNSGNYLAEITAGNINRKLPFSIISNKTARSSPTSENTWFTYISYALSGLIIVSIIVYLLYRNKK